MRDTDMETAALIIPAQAQRVLAEPVSRITDSALRRQLVADALDGTLITDRAWQLVEDYEAGTLDQATRDRLDAGMTTITERVFDPKEEVYLSGFGAQQPLGAKGLAFRESNTGNDPLPSVVQKAIDEADREVRKTAKRVAEAQARADAAAGRRVLTPEQYRANAGKQAVDQLRQARAAAARVVREDRGRALDAAGIKRPKGSKELPEVAGHKPRPDISDAELTERLAGKLMAGRRSKNPALAELGAELAASGRLTSALDLPDPNRIFAPVEARARQVGCVAEADRSAARMAARADAEGPRVEAAQRMFSDEVGPADNAAATRPLEQAIRSRRVRAARTKRAARPAVEAQQRIAPAEAGAILPGVAPDAVKAAWDKAYVAWTGDQQVARSGETSRPGRSSLDANGKALYDFLHAEEGQRAAGRQVTGTRDAMVDRLVDQGRRGGQTEGRAVGKAQGRKQVFADTARTAEGRAARLASELPDGWEAKAEATAATLDRPVADARRAGFREAEATAAERALAKELRAHARNAERLDGAARTAAAALDAIPAKYKAASRTAGNLAEGALREARRLEERAASGRGSAADLVTAGILREIATEVPTSLAGLQDAGVFAPEFRAGATPSSSGLPSRAEALPTSRKSRAERLSRRDAGQTEFTLEGQGRELVAEVRRNHMNEQARRVAEEWGVKGETFGPFLKGPQLAAAARAQGFTAWNPASLFEAVSDAQVNAGTTFVPTHVFDAYRNSYGPKSLMEQRLERYYDRTFLGTVRYGWLALSPKWLVGNVVGNALMGMSEAGVGFLAALPEAIDIVRRGEMPERFGGAGFTSTQPLLTTKAQPGAIRRTADRSYAFNSYVDNIARTAVYVAKKADGVDPARAVDLALRSVGDFRRMSAFERTTVRRIIPFWGWYKHITRLTLSLPVTHPRRVVWAWHLGEVFGPERDPDAPRYAGSGWPLGGNEFLMFGGMNPFGDPSELPLTSVKSLRGTVTPAISWGWALGMGEDFRDGTPLSRPPGSYAIDDFGRDRAVPLWKDPQALAWYLSRQFPQGRTATEVLTDPVVRYDSGEPVVFSGGTKPSGRVSRLDEIGGFLGVPSRRRIDVDDIKQRRADAVAQAAKDRASYEKRRKAAGQ